MSQDDLPPAEPRRKDAAATRAAIVRAAREAFTRLGYDGAGVREIARAADVDTRLITRYFGSKEGLFAEVVDVAYEKSLMMTPELNAQAARALLMDPDSSAHDGLLLTLRSASNERAAAIMRDSIQRNYQRRLADALPGSDTVARSALLIAICSGVLLSRMVLGHTELNRPETEQLIPLLHAALDAVAAAPGTGQAAVAAAPAGETAGPSATA
ncbi:TetR/AcrR family transcriptional regulator [Actinacidiphila acididurans]|uniref:TetR/AcrR family transcriptional regulator n=1 Tax=Actinacidiphila acididurans TaxID=2784346 RepID=A0ABS2TPI4_9ACTN|nr:TetR/AcrR family transcriptional regulator [Actinacidiphila acididurans]MBM9504416.1 TetR/AcrR family transcriptional regulator [Actinacidiphila acididurans]